MTPSLKELDTSRAETAAARNDLDLLSEKYRAAVEQAAADFAEIDRERIAANVRAEALERELDVAKSTALKQHGLAQTYLNAAVGWERRAEAAEAKLAKAVEALILIGNDVMTDHNGDRWQTEAAQIARRALAEIEGKSK